MQISSFTASKNAANLINAINPAGINLPEFRARYPITPPRTALHTSKHNNSIEGISSHKMIVMVSRMMADTQSLQSP